MFSAGRCDYRPHKLWALTANCERLLLAESGSLVRQVSARSALDS
jgi:hypothetical protein